MPGPFRIFVGGQELLGFTSATLSRSKDQLTGQLDIDLFFGFVPGEPVLTSSAAGAEIVVYVAGNIAFYGSIDKRTGGSKSGSDRSVAIGPNEYTVRLTARGRAKALVDSSHRHPTTNMLQPTNTEVIDKLLEGSNVQADYLCQTIKLDKVRFRDGALVVDELRRVAAENAHYIYETRDGKLRVTDDTGRTAGDNLVLGQNILRFTAEQSEDTDRAEIRVKGQRTAKDVWGEEAVLNTMKTVSNGNSTNKAPIIIQHYGDATEEALERRANFEANKRMAGSKTVTVDVFHVQSDTSPWDIGTTHYVEIPPEGIFDQFECTGLKYTVTASDTLETQLTLSPLPSTGVVGGTTGLPALFSSLADLAAFSASRKAQLGVKTQPGQYPASWTGPNLSIADPLTSVLDIAAKAINLLDLQVVPEGPPAKLPSHLAEE